MLGLHARGGRRALDRIEPVHAVFRLLAPRRVVAHELVKSRISCARNEIRIQRNNHIGAAQVILNIHAACEKCSSERGIVLHQLRLRPRLLHFAPLPRQRGRRDGRAQEVDAGSILGRSNFVAQRLGKLRPLATLTAIGDVLRAVGIVQVEQRALRIRIGAAMVVGVLRIAVDLDRPELVALDQQRHSARGERMRRGKVHRLAENQILRRLDVGINRLIGLLGATGQARESHRRAHQFEEAAPRNRIDPLLRRRGKLALHRSLKFLVLASSSSERQYFLPFVPAQLAPHRLKRHGLGQPGAGNSAACCSIGLSTLLSRFAHRWHTSQLVRSFGVRMW